MLAAFPSGCGEREGTAEVWGGSADTRWRHCRLRLPRVQDREGSRRLCCRLFYCIGRGVGEGDNSLRLFCRGVEVVCNLFDTLPWSAAGRVSLHRVDVALSPQRWHWMSFAFSWDIIFHPIGSPAPGWYSCKSFPLCIHSPLVCCGFAFNEACEEGSLFCEVN